MNSSAIYKNASLLLEEKKIKEELHSIGTLYFTGSYALDLMTWNDIDMQIVLKEEANPMQSLSSFFMNMCKDKDFFQGKIQRYEGDYKPFFPRGVYVQLQIGNERYGGLWKIDLWAMSQKDIDQNQKEIDRIKAALTKATRTLILTMKHALMKKTGRIPQRGSHFLYDAVLFQHLRSEEEIFSYLKGHGVEI